MNEKSSQDVRFDSPISEPQKKKVKTSAITLRMPIWWIKRLDRIAREASFRDQKNIKSTDLIRQAIFKKFIDGLERVPTYGDCEREESRSNFKLLSQVVKAALSGQRE